MIQRFYTRLQKMFAPQQSNAAIMYQRELDRELRKQENAHKRFIEAKYARLAKAMKGMTLDEAKAYMRKELGLD